MLSPEEVEEKVVRYIGELNPDVFVVEYKLVRSKSNSLTILLDTLDGITIDECARISRKVGFYLDESDAFPFAYRLEVSSPGVGRPLRVFPQYQQNIGRKLKVTDHDGKTVKGVLKAATPDYILLEPDKGKKKKKKDEAEEPAELKIEMNQIKEAKVEVSFN